jgi:cell division protein FtsW
MMITNWLLPSLRPLRAGPDRQLLGLWLALMSVGLIMIASASVAFAAANYGDAWFFVRRHSVFMLLGLVLALVVVSIPVHLWQRYSGWLLLFSLLLLIIVLVPGIGKKVNGSQRWLDFGLISVQVSEIAKFCAVVFFASFFARRHQELHSGWQGFIKPLLILGLFAVLLLLEPDFGSAVVLCATVFAIMFIAGVKLRHFTLLLALGCSLLAVVAITSPYRMKRLITFLDPWSDQFNSGYQLTQSLIAFGRGEWFGLGLGNSLQKLFYLPEAHTDFIFAIVAEEFGLLGAVLLIGLFAAMILRMLIIARNNVQAGKLFAGFAVFGVAILFAFQVFINIGVAAGLLPTKGLTLPFISYGGSSLLISCLLIAFALRVELEYRQSQIAPESRPARAPRRQLVLKEAL